MVRRQVLQILTLIGDEWSILLRDRPLRFGELHRAIKGISQSMLTLPLRQLEHDGLLTWTVHPIAPSRVGYALTPLGATLLDSVTALVEGATAHRQEINNHRRRYDATHSPGTRP
ncbi:helix-turn-helix domain-containing protein [Nonomuraea sp. NPDC000554]|uniref:winged helix-turn-helix transcriptional regulator n=1 Tax=Nonomuraea sp. NPDC000554 TaxID=3154259 RepID=UPI0033239B59